MEQPAKVQSSSASSSRRRRLTWRPNQSCSTRRISCRSSWLTRWSASLAVGRVPPPPPPIRFCSKIKWLAPARASISIDESSVWQINIHPSATRELRRQPDSFVACSSLELASAGCSRATDRMAGGGQDKQSTDRRTCQRQRRCTTSKAIIGVGATI